MWQRFPTEQLPLVRLYTMVLILVGMFLVGFSYFCIHYASEARGYAYAVLFALVAYYLLDRSHALRSLAGAAAFGVAAILGLLSQLTFAYAYGALLVWSIVRQHSYAEAEITLDREIVACGSQDQVVIDLVAEEQLQRHRTESGAA